MKSKINYNDIEWKNKGILYRGTFQHVFEKRILETIVEKNEPFYYGRNEDGGKLTYCSPQFHTAVFYIEERNRYLNLSKFKGKPIGWPFSDFPLILEINTKNYKNRLFYDSESIIIKDPINLNDINVLFSSYINRIEGFRYIQNLDKIFAKEGMKQDILTYLDEDPEKTMAELRIWAYGTRLELSLAGYSKDENIIKFIDILREKLRP